MNPLLSICVIIAAKDAAATIQRCVASALRQPEATEVIVVDDGSSDATAQEAKAADDGSRRLRISRLARNLGPAAARNCALEMTTSETVCVLDADDWLMDGRLGRLLTRGGAEWDLLADDLYLAPDASETSPLTRLLGLQSGAESIDAEAFIRSNITHPGRARREMGYLKPLMRLSFLRRHGLSYDDRLRLGEDYLLYTRALLHGARFVLVPACGYVAVQRPGSLSHQHGAADLMALCSADTRLIAEAAAHRPQSASALHAHRRSVKRNLSHRLMLEAKRANDWGGVASNLFRSPATTGYILRQTWLDKSRR